MHSFFEILGLLIVALCFLPSAARSLKRTKNTGGFWDPLAHFEVEGVRHFGSGSVSKNSRFYHVLSVSVVPSVSCGECHRVGHVVICFQSRAFLIKSSKFVVFHPNFELFHFIQELFGKMKSGCPERREKEGSKFQGPTCMLVSRASRNPPSVCVACLSTTIPTRLCPAILPGCQGPP